MDCRAQLGAHLGSSGATGGSLIVICIIWCDARSREPGRPMKACRVSSELGFQAQAPACFLSFMPTYLHSTLRSGHGHDGDCEHIRIRPAQGLFDSSQACCIKMYQASLHILPTTLFFSEMRSLPYIAVACICVFVCTGLMSMRKPRQPRIWQRLRSIEDQGLRVEADAAPTSRALAHVPWPGGSENRGTVLVASEKTELW